MASIRGRTATMGAGTTCCWKRCQSPAAATMGCRGAARGRSSRGIGMAVARGSGAIDKGMMGGSKGDTGKSDPGKQATGGTGRAGGNPEAAQSAATGTGLPKADANMSTRRSVGGMTECRLFLPLLRLLYLESCKRIVHHCLPLCDFIVLRCYKSNRVNLHPSATKRNK